MKRNSLFAVVLAFVFLFQNLLVSSGLSQEEGKQAGVKISQNSSNKKTDRFIVKYKAVNSRNGMSSKEIPNGTNKSNLNQVFKSDLKKSDRINDTSNGAYDIVTLNTEATIEEFAAKINQESVKNEIEYIQPDYEVSLSSLDPYFSQQWALKYDKSSVLPNKLESDTSIEIIRSVLPKTADKIESNPEWLKFFESTLPSELLERIEVMNAPQYIPSEIINEINNNSIIEDLLNSQGNNNEQQAESEYLCDANIVPAWDQSTGAGEVVAVIDTGIDISHEDLTRNIWINQDEIPANGLDDDLNGYIDDINGWDFRNETNTVHNQVLSIDEKHGTSIAGIISAVKDNGIGIAGAAPDTRIMTLKVFENGTAYTSDIIEAINYASSKGVKIINCSWGGTEDNQILKETIQNAADTLFICASGNNNTNIDETPIYPASFDCQNIITVASVDRNGRMPVFSNYGQKSVDVAAPGKDILSTSPSNKYEENSGTSMSAAFVSAEAAVLMSKYANVTLLELKDRIINCSDRLSSLTGKVFQGGKINFLYALNNTVNANIIEVAGNDSNQTVNQVLEQGKGFSLFSAPTVGGQFEKITGGDYHSLALKKDGTVWAFGENAYGKLGDGSTSTRIYPVQVVGLNNVIDIAAGDEHSLALKSDGTVWAWGYNSDGQLGDGTFATRYTPVQVPSLSNIKGIVTVDDTSLALKSDGTVWAWGENDHGELGNGTLLKSNIPVQVSNLSDVGAIAGGDDHSLALKNDGTVWTWGKNSYGQLGNNTNTGSNIPVRVSNLNNIIAISGGDEHCLALKEDKTVWSWGENNDGELGNGNMTNSMVPVQVSGLNNIISIVSGLADHNVALKNDGTVWGWGDNDRGQLGDGTNLNKVIPIQINNVSNAVKIGVGSNTTFVIRNDGTVWGCGSNSHGKLGIREFEYSANPVSVSNISDIKSVSAGGYHNIAVINDGTVYTWGSGEEGQLGTGTLMNSAIPVQAPGLAGVTEADSGNLHCLALKNDGTVWAWGNNSFGQLGDGTTIKKLIPTQIVGLNNVVALSAGMNHSLALKSDGTVWAWGYNEDGELGDGTTVNKTVPVQVSGLVNIVSITAGQYHNLAVSSSGVVYSWGYNYYGQLGDGTTVNRTTPVQVSGLSNVSSISAGGYHSLALTNSGQVYSWGYNGYGQLGDGTTTNRNTPAQVSGLSGVINISAGVQHSIAVISDATVRVWGLNYYGQLGDGSTSTRRAPVQINGLSGIAKAAASDDHSVLLKTDGTLCSFGNFSRGRLGNGKLGYYTAAQWLFGTVATSKFIKTVSFYNHNLALKDDGTVWAWGNNSSGQLGDGTMVNKSAPVLVSGLSNIVDIACGEDNSLALKDDGTVWTWGDNYYGQLGDGTNTQKSIAVKINNLSDITAIACGSTHSMALKSDGTVWVWGRNIYGQLGDGTTVNRNSPIQVANLISISSISAGAHSSFSLKADGTLWSWGYNGYGTLGDGTYTNRFVPVQVNGINDVKEVSCGLYHVLAVKNNGTLWSWGKNTFGELGIGVTLNCSIPLRVNFLSQVKNASAGFGQSLAVKADGTVWAWGDNAYGQLGDNTFINRTMPIKIQLEGISNVSCGYYHSIALNYNGDLWAWGNNSHGQIGDGTTSSSNSLVHVSSLNSVISVSAGYNHGLALRNNGTVLAWGNNNDGQLGNGAYSNSNFPVQVNGLTHATGIAAGAWHNLALKSDGSVWAWGNNGYGQLGDGTAVTRRTPVRVNGLSNIIAISAGEYFSVALKSDGTVWAWGRNVNGELGDGTNTNRSIPVQINGLSGVTAVDCGAYHCLAIKSDGTVWVWGRNESGQLGNGTTTNTNIPATISNLNNISAINGTPRHSFAVANDGSVYSWGYNGNGELGDGAYNNRNTPVKLSNITGFSSISGGFNHNVAMKNDGSLWSWGQNKYGQLGNGLNNTINVPSQVSSVSSVQQVSAGYYFSIVLKSDGTVWTCGYNFHGQLGLGALGVVAYPKFIGTLSVSTLSNIVIMQKTGSYIALSWNPAQGALEYIVQADGVERSVGTKTTFKHTGLLPDTQHTYRVRFRTSSGLSEWSSIIPVITEANIPGGVQGITAYPDKTSITFVWDEVQDAQKYLVEFDGDKVDKGMNTSCVRYGLLPNTPHTFRLKAVNSLGEGAWSTLVTVNTFPLDIPSNLTVVENTDNVYLTWNAVEGALQYDLEINGRVPVTVTGTSYLHTGLAPESLKNYRIRAVSLQGVSAWSDGVTVFTLPVKPNVPQNVLALARADCVTLSWDVVSGAVGYDVELDNVVIDLDANSYVIDNTNKMKYVHEELLPNTSHTYRVRAKNIAIEGEWSSPVVVKTLPETPEAPKDIRIFTSSTSAKIVWASENGALSYNIEIYDGTNTTVVNNITKNEYTHRRAATGKEYTYRISTKNILGTSSWSGYIINNSIRAACAKGRNIDLGLTATDIVDFSRYTLTVTYNPDVLEVTDLSTLSTEKEINEGKIAGTDITITAFTPGKITFVTNKAVTLGESWTGVVNNIEFKAKVSGGTHLAYTVESKAEEIE